VTVPAPIPVPEEGRVTLVLTSPRSAAGLLTWAGWERLHQADAVLAADPEPGWLEAFAQAGVAVTDVSELPIGERAGRLVQEAAAGLDLVWWGSPDGDPGLTDALAEHLSRRAVAGRPPEVEVLTASHDVPGSRLLDLVAVMDTLRSPGGCPWDAEQTHTSLLPYLLEETHEVIEAVEARDRDHLVEELGDLLLQVVFHARVGAENRTEPFDIDEVAAGIVAKLVRRHPHVFGDPDGGSVDGADVDGGSVDGADVDGAAADGREANAGADGSAGDAHGDPKLTAADVELSWEALKAAEKPRRQAFEGIPASLPALARAQKMLGRLQKTGSDVDLDAALAVAADGDELAATLLHAVRTARATGVDAESQLRAALRRLPNPS
jgi:NTP pyrophosphatase (non-canonical NTP hydrolase)